MPAGLEIERKYLVRMPDEAFLATVQGASVANITQTYLVPAIPRQTERVRKSEKGGKGGERNALFGVIEFFGLINRVGGVVDA